MQGKRRMFAGCRVIPNHEIHNRGNKTLLIIDVDGLISAAEHEGVEMEFKQLKEFLQPDIWPHHSWSHRNVAVGVLGVNEKQPTIKDRHIEKLERAGFHVEKTKAFQNGLTELNNNTHEIIRWITKKAFKDGFSKFTVVSGDEALLSTVKMLKLEGLIVEVVQFESKVSYDLAHYATGYINLTKYISNENKEDYNENYGL